MSEQEVDPVPWPERLRDWWKCSVCGSRLGHHNSRYEENHKLRTHIKRLEDERDAYIKKLEERIRVLESYGDSLVYAMTHVSEDGGDRIEDMRRVLARKEEEVV